MPQANYGVGMTADELYDVLTERHGVPEWLTNQLGQHVRLKDVLGVIDDDLADGIRREAYRDGYEAAYGDGYDKGYRAGRDDGFDEGLASGAPETSSTKGVLRRGGAS